MDIGRFSLQTDYDYLVTRPVAEKNGGTNGLLCVTEEGPFLDVKAEWLGGTE
jgi:hypothetical protein